MAHALAPVDPDLHTPGRAGLTITIPDHVLARMDFDPAGGVALLLHILDAAKVADSGCPAPALHVVPHLSPQERVVLVHYASGLTLAAAARRAGVQPATAKKYLDRVKEKYAACGRVSYTKLDLAARAREDGVLKTP